MTLPHSNRQDAARAGSSGPSAFLSGASGTWVRRLQKDFPGQRATKTTLCMPWPTSRNKIARNHRQNHHENTLKKPGFEGVFFSVQSLSSILHFCAFLVARSGHSGFEWFWDALNEPSQNQAFSCLPTTRGYVWNWIILNLIPCVIWYMKMIEQYWTCVF